MNQPLCLVTGGAGFLGINLVRLLLSRNWAVRSLDTAAFDYPEKPLVDAITGDVRDPATVNRAMTGVQSVVHAAAALPLAEEPDILSTGITGTRILLDAALAQGVARFVYLSSTAVYGIGHHHPLLESDPLKGVGPYGRTKIEAEVWCEAARRRGLCVTVLRPKSFVGPERLGAFELLYDWALDGRGFPVLGRGNNLYQLLDVEDLCELIHLCLTVKDDAVCDTFNVAAARYGTMHENIQAVLDRAGHGRQVIALPAGPAILVLRLLAALGLSPLYPWIYETAGQDSVVSIERLRTRLGFTPRHSNQDALIRNFDWYVAHRDEYRGRRGVSHRLPWKRGVLRLARYLF